jgi:hypothetical protein
VTRVTGSMISGDNFAGGDGGRCVLMSTFTDVSLIAAASDDRTYSGESVG